MSLTEGVIETDLYVKPTDSISIYSLARATLSIVKKGIPYSQVKLHLFRNSFDKRCIDLERFLFERGYSSKLVQKGILQARKIGFKNNKDLKSHLVGDPLSQMLMR